MHQLEMQRSFKKGGKRLSVQRVLEIHGLDKMMIIFPGILPGSPAVSVSYSVGGADNARFKRKPAIMPISPTKAAKVKEKPPPSLVRLLRLFSIS